MWKRLVSAALALLLCCALLPAVSAENAKLMALTFDDGPEYVNTPAMLDVLSARGVKATFFMVGQWTKGKDEIIQRVLEEGHQIGSHTQDHKNLTKLTDDQVRYQVDTFADTMMGFLDQTDYMLRPPFGGCNAHVLSLVDAPVIHWTIDPAKGYKVPATEMAETIVREARDGAIILMHDTTAENVEATAAAIDALHGLGYEFVTVQELFRLKGVTPEPGVMYRSVENPAPYAFDEARLPEHWAWGALRYVQETGLMVGDGEGMKPNQPMTRAMAVTLLWRAEGAPAPTVLGASGFCDVPGGAWHSDAVKWARQSGVVEGYSGTVFGTEDHITREQFYCVLYRLAAGRGVSTGRSELPGYGDDARISPWAVEAVQGLRQMGFRSQNDVELLRPHDNIARAEAAEMLQWYLETL
jgi:peptidoglycan/xylan/chitin deacetylase (PgdA/CDA1 family)